MRRNLPPCAPWIAAVLVGCGGFDPEYDCEQRVACEGEPNDALLEACVDLAEDLYDELSKDEADIVDDQFEQCSDEAACDYVACVGKFATGGVPTKADFCAVCSDSLTPGCEQAYDLCRADPDCSFEELGTYYADNCTAEVSVCGNDVAEAGESCDGLDFREGTCATSTAGRFPMGSLRCNSNCTLNISMCFAP